MLDTYISRDDDLENFIGRHLEALMYQVNVISKLLVK